MLRVVRIALLTLAAIAVPVGMPLGFFALSENYNYCAGHDGQHPTAEFYPDGSPIIERPISNPSRMRLLVYCSGVWAGDNGAGITAVGTLLLFLVTCILGWIAWRQFWTTRAQLRAYLSITPISLVNPAVGLKTHAIYRVTNEGETPANEVRHLCTLVVLFHPIPANTQDLVAAAPGQITPTPTLFKAKWFEAEAAFPDSGTFQQEAYHAAIAGDKHRLYFIGVAHYKDVFGIWRKTRCAYYLESDALLAMATKQKSGVPAKMDWIMSDSHNEAY